MDHSHPGINRPLLQSSVRRSAWHAFNGAGDLASLADERRGAALQFETVTVAE